MTLADAIAKAHVLNEQKVGAGIPIPVQFNSTTTLLLDPFNRYAAFHGCKNCPASPKVVAAWVRAAKDNDPAKIIETLSAIELLHDVHGLSNPVATSVVRAELEKVLQIEPPRSLARADQLRFSALPIETRAILGRRIRQMEVAMRRAQNAAAEAKRQCGADKPAPTEETKNDS
jgi:hypothetical protein